MNLQKFIVVPAIPEEIRSIKDIAENMWWTWNQDAVKLYSMIDEKVWEKSYYNPIKFLNTVSEEKMKEAAKNEKYMTLYKNMVRKFDKYLNETNTWLLENYREHKDSVVCYMSAEYALCEAFPMYSGGLGVLAGDHLKSASDLGINLVAVGLIYKTGYFKQHINHHGEQVNVYEEHDFSEFPIKLVRDKSGERLIIEFYMADKLCYAQAWQVDIGINKLYLLDMDIDENPMELRNINYTLYDSGVDMRVKQEILLGIGGVILIDALGINVSAWHMNEGHSAFSVIQRTINEMRSSGSNFYEAFEAIRSNTTFTTHTPVPAGNDVFFQDTVELYLNKYIETLGISKKDFFKYATINPEQKVFSMTVFALKSSYYLNGVSKLHAAVSREMWKDIWPKLASEEVPIDYITNGVHLPTWQSNSISNLIDHDVEEKYRSNLDSTRLWEEIDSISDEVLWKKHMELKKELIKEINKRLTDPAISSNKRSEPVSLDASILTIGFARRFATYKRADLIFREIDKIKDIIANDDFPVQIIMAGKAHPADKPGQEIIKRIYEISKDPVFKGRIIILENYDMNVARKLVQGVDVWLNNPRRPYEASGTSGEKAAMNGILNFSILDGWWPEAYDKTNGFVIGGYKEFDKEEEQDAFDANSLYDVLENEIIPTYYEKNEQGYSERWLRYMKNSIKTITPYFNMHRQVKEYFTKFYLECFQNKNMFYSENLEVAKYVSKWKEKVYRSWDGVRIVNEEINVKNQSTLGEEIRVNAVVNLENLSEEDVRVEVFLGELNDKHDLLKYWVVPMKPKDKISKNTYMYETNLKFENVGVYGINTRVVPQNKFLKDKNEIGLVKWSK